jgi:hypothetical protein
MYGGLMTSPRKRPASRILRLNQRFLLVSLMIQLLAYAVRHSLQALFTAECTLQHLPTPRFFAVARAESRPSR